MVLLGIVSQEEAFEHIDFNVIFLLAGMMILAAIIRKTGVFGWLAIRAARFAGGDPLPDPGRDGRHHRHRLGLPGQRHHGGPGRADHALPGGPARHEPVSVHHGEILASNIGGSATLIGDPPNILIGSAAGIDFVTFAANMAPLAVINLVLFLVAARWLFRGQLEVDPALRDALLALDEREMIADPALLRKSLVVLGLTLVGFLLHGQLGLEPATVALTGAVALMIVAREDPHEVLREVEWPTLFFFIGLFMLVAGVIEIGLIEAIADVLVAVTGGAWRPARSCSCGCRRSCRASSTTSRTRPP